MPDVRARAGRISPAMERDIEISFEQESAEDFPRGAGGLVRYAHLAISGGGSKGAFGAGFLNGWTSTGKRPTFKIVTGVSTGALMAPFAFLGPDFDDALREFYTTVRSRDIFVLGSIVRQLLVGESLANTEPLAALIAQHIDAAFLWRIAEAHNRGRRLYIGTTDLDSQTFVV
jgi:predicted acylesterase/phospholipase RssA